MRGLWLGALLIATAGLSAPPDNRPPDNRPPGSSSPPVVTTETTVDVEGPRVDVGPQSVSVSHETPDDVTIRSTPSIGIATPPNSAGMGIAFPGGGLTFNIPLDRAYARLRGFWDMGMPEVGIADYCRGRRARALGGADECAAMMRASLTPPPVVAVDDARIDALQQEVDELRRRLVEEQERHRAIDRVIVDQRRQRQEMETEKRARERALKALEGLRGP